MGLLVKDDTHVRLSLKINKQIFSVIGLTEGTNFAEIKPADRTSYLLKQMIPHAILEGKNYHAAIDDMATSGFITSFSASATYNNQAANYTNTNGVDGVDLFNMHINDVKNDSQTMHFYPHGNSDNMKTPGVLGGTPNGILEGTSDAQDPNGFNNIFDANPGCPFDNPPKFWAAMLQDGVSDQITEYLLREVNIAMAMDKRGKMPFGDKLVLQYVKGLLEEAGVHTKEATSAAGVFLKYIDVFASWQGAYRDNDTRKSPIIDESSMQSFDDDANDEDYVYEASSSVSSFTGIGTGDGRARKKAKTTHDSWQPSSNDPQEDDDSNYEREVDLIDYKANRTYKSEENSKIRPSFGHKALLTGGVRKGNHHRAVGPAPFSSRRSRSATSSASRSAASSASQSAASSASRSAASLASRSTTSSEVDAGFQPIYAHTNTPYPNEAPLLGVSILPGPGSSNAVNPGDKSMTTVASEQRIHSLRNSADYCGMTSTTGHLVYYNYWPTNQYRGCISFPKHVTNGTAKHKSMGTNMEGVHDMLMVNINESRDGVEPGLVKPGDVVTSYGDDITWVTECWYVGVYMLVDGRKLGAKVGIVKVMYDQLHLYVNRVGVVAERTFVNKKGPTDRFQKDVYGCLTVNLIDGNFTRDIPDHLIVRSN